MICTILVYCTLTLVPLFESYSEMIWFRNISMAAAAANAQLRVYQRRATYSSPSAPTMLGVRGTAPNGPKCSHLLLMPKLFSSLACFSSYFRPLAYRQPASAKCGQQCLIKGG